MTNHLRNFVSVLSSEERRQIHADYLVLEETGAVGVCTLRRKADELMRLLGAEGTGVALWMKEIMTEVWRFEAVSALEADSPLVLIDARHLDELTKLVSDCLESESDNDWDREARELLEAIGRKP